MILLVIIDRGSTTHDLRLGESEPADSVFDESLLVSVGELIPQGQYVGTAGSHHPAPLV